MEENIFSYCAHNELNQLFELLQIPRKFEDLDVDLQDDVLYITLPTNQQYVINKHTPSQQIWLSSPISGAAYFSYQENNKSWLNKQHIELKSLLLSELQKYE